jgi:hypothetical protein
MPRRVDSLLNVLAGPVKEAREQVRKLVDEDLANLTKMMRDAGIPPGPLTYLTPLITG